MEITTKYSINDEVWCIVESSARKLRVCGIEVIVTSKEKTQLTGTGAGKGPDVKKIYTGEFHEPKIKFAYRLQIATCNTIRRMCGKPESILKQEYQLHLTKEELMSSL